VVHTLFEGFVLVVIVVFLFLGSFRATLIPLIAVPVSLIGTFSVMLAFGFSANTVSLLALVLAIGIVVDDAIVVVEAVEAHLEKDPTLSPAEAARRAMEEITAPIIAITLVLLSVFVPVAFIPGISGDLVQTVRRRRVGLDDHFGAQRADAVAGSLRGLPVGETRPKRGLMRYVLQGIDTTRDGYVVVVRKITRFAIYGLVALVAAMAGAGWLFKAVPSRIPALRGPGRGVRRGAIVRGRVGQSHRLRSPSASRKSCAARRASSTSRPSSATA
jgi:multidrug efflux pump subunit AcrB